MSRHNPMKDKDKLILVLEVGIKETSVEYAIHKINSTCSWLEKRLDDSILILPTYSEKHTDIKIKELNTENYTEDEVENIIEKTKRLIKEFKNRLKEDIDGEKS